MLEIIILACGIGSLCFFLYVFYVQMNYTINKQRNLINKYNVRMKEAWEYNDTMKRQLAEHKQACVRLAFAYQAALAEGKVPSGVVFKDPTEDNVSCAIRYVFQHPTAAHYAVFAKDYTIE